MRCSMTVLAVLILVGAAQADDLDQPWQIHGQVVDEQGTPVEDFEAAEFWLANGNWWDEEGELLEEAKAGKLWTNEGVLAARPTEIAKRLPEGRFSLTVDGGPRGVVFAVDKLRERGGIALVEKSEADKPVTITLAPLVHVTGEVYCSEADKMPEWSNATLYIPDEKGNRTKLTICGSFRGKISFLLPPGKYDLEVHSELPRGSLRRPKAQKGKDAEGAPLLPPLRVVIPAGKATHDLGVLDIVLLRDKEGNPSDITQFYGKKLPELALTDARGVPQDVKLADFRGKWVLLEFWTVRCGPCVQHSLPELTKFYEEHAADRDRFEILAICNTENEKAPTIEAYDALVAGLVEKLWSGKPLPFPVLIDGDGKTFGAYGWSSRLLIDPKGRLVKGGDLTMLAEKLKEQNP